MKDDHRFMNELFRIVNGALRLDIERVRNYTEYLAQKLEKDGNKNAADRLRKMLEENDHQLRPTETSFSRAIPVDTDSRFPLIERVNVRASEEASVILSQEQWDVVKEFVSIAKSYGQLDAKDAAGSICMLMYGPPGTGKSHLARHVAAELDLDLYVARLDGLISSFLGSTSKNIRALFDFAAKTPCVLFLDEFDAIAKLRGDHQELGELKRVVNSFIQNLDSLGSQSIVLAATNHKELLDAAVWRRFSYRVALEYPTSELREELCRQYLGGFSFADRDIEILVDLSEGFSGSDIFEVSRRLKRRSITTKEEPGLNEAFQILQNLSMGEGEERRFVSVLRGKGANEISVSLHERNEKLYSSAAIAELLSVSKSTAYRMTQKKAGQDGRQQEAGS